MLLCGRSFPWKDSFELENLSIFAKVYVHYHVMVKLEKLIIKIKYKYGKEEFTPLEGALGGIMGGIIGGDFAGNRLVEIAIE